MDPFQDTASATRLRMALLRAGVVPAPWLEPIRRLWLDDHRENPTALHGFSRGDASRGDGLALLLMLPLGIYGYKISFILHDCAHDTLFRTRSLNQWIGRVCGWLVAADFFQFKLLHADHHRYNGANLDPQWRETGGLDGASRSRLLWHLFGAIVGQRVVAYFSYYISYCIAARPGSDAAAQRPTRRSISNLAGIAGAQIAIALLVSGFGQMPWLVIIYPVSAATISLLLGRLRTFAEHVQAPESSIADFARSHAPNWIDAFLLYDAHFNYHLEHHIYPHIPSRNLPQVHASCAAQVHSPLTWRRSMFGTIRQRVREARP